MRRVMLIAGLVVVSLMNGACGENSTGPTNASIAGTYNLQTVSGAALPFVTSAANPKSEIVGAQVIVSASGSWNATVSVRITTGTTVATQSQVSAGTYTLAGSIASFKNNADETITAVTVSGNTLSATSGGFIFVYTK